MSSVLEEVLTANARHAEAFGARARPGLPPARTIAILTCVDARLAPAGYAGLVEGDAHIIRNAGGRASDDAIRALVISHHVLGTREWLVIHHTPCNADSGPAPAALERQLGDVIEDVTRIRCHALVPDDLAIRGYLFDGKTGHLIEVPAATVIGGARRRAA